MAASFRPAEPQAMISKQPMPTSTYKYLPTKTPFPSTLEPDFAMCHVRLVPIEDRGLAPEQVECKHAIDYMLTMVQEVAQRAG